MLGNRQLIRICKAPFQMRHYRALINMACICGNFTENFRRYLTEKGEYPYDLTLRTPIGHIPVRLYNPHDLLTLNEVFFRVDYPADRDIEVVVDIGSNIGISALYFLTRNKRVRCYLHEPDVRNVVKLKRNLTDIEHRYFLTEKAVSYEAGEVEFGIEPTGRYGRIGANTGNSVKVECLEINNLLTDILGQEKHIDILKIDTEGVEIQTIEAIKPEILHYIGRIYVEATISRKIHSTIFRQRQYGGVCHLIRGHT